MEQIPIYAIKAVKWFFLGSVLVVNGAIAWGIVKQLGLSQPYTWFVIIGLLALVADEYLQKN